ncbi:hypothetical protein BGZ95_003659 [Linnemannia exigua]|uniref:BZIP domain-containing protein n=1 Tax=Linnemannia exigua TaxID=604196 RepID=A0AAD4H992_9FUNG|nr:hypothetical protein BGZ95_003659 [Linnemannia exigua]
MSTYQSTSSEADEARLKPSAASSTATNKKRARSASQGGQSSQDEQLSSTNKKRTTPTTTAAASSSSTQAAAAAAAAAAEQEQTGVNLRKEQNRAAQRAFRDRKERHLQQLENLIQDLKDQQFLLTTRFQREIQQLKTQNQLVVQENQYLREVVFAFESALNYRGDMEVLQDVKQGLYRRYVGKQQQQGNGVAAIGGGGREPQEQEQQGRQLPPPLPPLPTSPSPSLSSTRASLSPALQAATTITLGANHRSSTTASAIPPIHNDNNYNNLRSPSPSLTGREATGEGDYFSRGTIHSPSHRVPSASLSPSLQQVSNPLDATGAIETEATPTPYSINREILYRAPASLHVSELNGGGDDVSQATVGGGLLAAATTASSGGVVPLTPFFPAGTPLPKVTDYTKHPTVFDELQSSLFPPGALQALVSTNMASPLDVVNDTKLFDHLGDKSEDSTTAAGSSSTSARTKTTTTATSTTLATSNAHAATSSTSSYSTSTATTTTSSTKSTPPAAAGSPRSTPTWSRTELLQKTHRLQKTFKVLAAGPLRSDPKIDQQIYQIPHDSRIDLVPCPKLRAQMILHQHKYNIDEVFQLLIDKAICHGLPLEPSHWELPEEFFERYGFLIGVDLEHQRRKVWPRPLPPDMM